MSREGRDRGIEGRVRVRAPGDIWSDDFREELRHDRLFEGSLAFRELAILIAIAALLVARGLLV